MTQTPIDSLDIFISATLGKKAKHPVVLDVRNLTSIADAFVICSGSSNRQVTAIAEHIQRELKTQKIHPLSVDGIKDGHWVLLDYGHIIIHVFYDPIRSFYDLEGLWSDAKRVGIESLAAFTDSDSADDDIEEYIIE
ncbi:MAG: ribosome silencing factor [Desulfobacteraceae bacterium]|nr:ribosome silencing factor [Desulfobacteraceae bacterium]